LKLERCTKSESVYRGRILNLRVDQVEFDDGKFTVREVVEHRGAAAIVPLLQDKVVLVRQFRYAAGSELLEIPAGTLEQGEDPEACARRELEEETGYKCDELRKMFECFMAPGYSTEKIHFYLARNLEPSKMRTEDDERIQTELIPIAAAMERIRKGEIHDAKTVCGLYRALEIL
jgi:nudix-type nucleoside diphosphatase (YffH/AdpP family)